MFATLLAGALLGLSAHPDPCAKALPRGPVVPAPLVLSTDCGWFRLDTDGAASRLPVDWYATHKRPWRPRYGLTYQRTRPGRYLVRRDGRLVWRSTQLYFNEDGSGAFGPHAFAFASWRRGGVLLTDLRGPERLVVPGKGSYPVGFTQGKLLVSGHGRITIVSHGGTVLRRLRYRRSSSFTFDEATETVYFVTPGGVLTAAHGSAVRRIRRIDARGWIALLGRRLLTFTGLRQVAVLRRDDGSLVARASWHGARRELDAGPIVSDDGRLFAFRVSTARPGTRRSVGDVYLLRAGERRARVLYSHRMGQAGCGTGASLEWYGSSLLYRSVDGTGVAEAAVLGAGGSATMLTPLLRGLPRISPAAPGNAFWAADFLE